MKKMTLQVLLEKVRQSTGSTSGATSTVLAEDIVSNSRLFITETIMVL